MSRHEPANKSQARASFHQHHPRRSSSVPDTVTTTGTSAPMSQPAARQGSVIGAALLVTGSTYIAFTLGLLANALAARALGPDDFGRYAYVVWLVGVLVVLANNGLTTTAIRFISELRGAGRSADVGAVHGWLWRRQLASTAVTIAVMGVGASLLAPSDWRGSLLVFALVVAVCVLAKSVYLFDVSSAKGHREFGVEAASTAGLSVVNIIAIGALYWLHAGLPAFLWAFVAVSVCYALAARVLVRRRGIFASREPLDATLRARLGQHLFWTVILCLIAAFSNRAAETYLLNRLWSAADVGYFAIAAALCRGGAEMLTSGLTSVLMPLMAQGYGEDGVGRVRDILSASVRYFTFAGLVLAGVGAFWAEGLIMVIYGAKYQAAVPVFQVMVVATGLSLSLGAFGAVLSTTDNQRVRATSAGVLVALGAGLALALVPTYGLMGATASVAVGSVLSLAMLARVVGRTVGMTLPWNELLRQLAAAAVAAAIAGGCAWLWPQPLVGFVIGACYVVLFTFASIRVGSWTQNDARLLLEFAHRRPKQLGWLARWIDRSHAGGSTS